MRLSPYNPEMAESLYGRTFIREWRQNRGLSLRRLADRMEVEPGGKLIISHASLARIEQGKQPYSQPILEALSAALNVSVGALLEIHPDKEGDVVDLVRLLDQSKREQAIEYLRFLARK